MDVTAKKPEEKTKLNVTVSINSSAENSPSNDTNLDDKSVEKKIEPPNITKKPNDKLQGSIKKENTDEERDSNATKGSSKRSHRFLSNPELNCDTVVTICQPNSCKLRSQPDLRYICPTGCSPCIGGNIPIRNLGCSGCYYCLYGGYADCGDQYKMIPMHTSGSPCRNSLPRYQIVCQSRPIESSMNRFGSCQDQMPQKETILKLFSKPRIELGQPSDGIERKNSPNSPSPPNKMIMNLESNTCIVMPDFQEKKLPKKKKQKKKKNYIIIIDSESSSECGCSCCSESSSCTESDTVFERKSKHGKRSKRSKSKKSSKGSVHLKKSDIKEDYKPIELEK